MILNKRYLTENILTIVVVSYSLFIMANRTVEYYLFAIGSLVVVHLVNSRTLDKYISKSLLPLFIFMALCVLSTLWSLDPSLTLRKSEGLLVFLMISYFVTINYKFNKTILNKIAIFSAFIVSVVIIYLYFQYGTVRFIGSRLDLLENVTVSNSGAALLVMAIPFILGSIFDHGRDHPSRLVYVFAFGVSVVSIILSQSRGAYVFLILEVVVFTIFYQSRIGNKRLSIKKVAIVILLLQFIAIPLFLNQGKFRDEIMAPVIERTLDSRMFNSRGTVDVYRGDMVSSIFDILSTSPFGGIGFEGYSVYSRTTLGVREFSHNIFLTASEVGVFGLVLWVYIFMVSMYRGIHMYKQSDKSEKAFNLTLLIALMVGLAHSLFRPQLQNILFLIVLSIVLSHKRKSKLAW